MYKIRWTNKMTGQSGLVEKSSYHRHGCRSVVRTWKTESAALNAAKKFNEGFENLVYEVVK